MAINILGIRHHGPGSARNVKSFLEETKPDIVLVEGPPEADALLQWATHAEIKPPVALLVYQPENPQQAVFYPFAEFSPEWQAIVYAKQNNIHIRFMDLPVAHSFPIGKSEQAEVSRQEEENSKDAELRRQEEPDSTNAVLLPPSHALLRPSDSSDSSLPPIVPPAATLLPLLPSAPLLLPMDHLAKAAGFDDGEIWWEHAVEYRQDNVQVFDAVAEAMTALRQELPQREDRHEALREAHMRKTIRQAEKEMFQNIAVICGAWHVPALTNMPKQKEDNDLLKGLPKVKTECTWIPWTYSRLSYASGYGAGIPSPGWYEHIWKYPTDDGTRWMARVAKLFRSKQMDTSVAHVMEAVRLANSLAALRHLSRPGLEELNEATLSVLCMGESIMMHLIHNELIVSNVIGEVPSEVPKPPLQLDIEKIQKRLRLPATADWKDYTLDLRKENDLERSVFLHRLQLLEIKWGERSEVGGKGTFKEQWRLQWDPGFAIDIIEKGNWGNTVEQAANSYVMHKAGGSASLADICALLEKAIPSELAGAVQSLISQINNLAAASGDVIQLMEVIPSLVSVSRYGNVRKTDGEMVRGIVESMITRICISLPAACTNISEDAAQHLLELFYKMNDAVSLLQLPEITMQWQQTLGITAQNKNTAPVIAGYATRLLADHKILSGIDLTAAFSYAMSTGSLPAVAAAWLEGFLKGSGTLLLLDHDLWSLVANWVSQLDDDIFVTVLPLLRRTFANFTKPERRKLGEKVKAGSNGQPKAAQAISDDIDEQRAKRGINVVMNLFGYANLPNA